MTLKHLNSLKSKKNQRLPVSYPFSHLLSKITRSDIYWMRMCTKERGLISAMRIFSLKKEGVLLYWLEYGCSETQHCMYMSSSTQYGSFGTLGYFCKLDALKHVKNEYSIKILIWGLFPYQWNILLFSDFGVDCLFGFWELATFIGGQQIDSLGLIRCETLVECSSKWGLWLV